MAPSARPIEPDDEDPILRLDDLPAGVAIAWGRHVVPSRGPRPGLTIDQIVETAIELADQGGIAAVSMARVAQALGYTTMSLYRYVATKDDLVALMADTALGAPPTEIRGSSAWQVAIDQWARSILAVYRAHAWVFDVPLSGPPAMPNQLEWLDQLLRGLAGSGLTDQEQLSTALLVDGYVRSWAQLSQSLVESAQRQAAGELRVVTAEHLRVLVTADRFPALAPMIANGEFDDQGETNGEGDIDDVLDFSLERIIDGIAALIATRKRQRRRPISRSNRDPAGGAG
jgi:AcrR family transcriptional regulator